MSRSGRYPPPNRERRTISAKVHSSALVLIPPTSVWPAIQAIRQAHDRQINRWMPHVTLLYPFAPRDQFDDILERLSDAAGESDPFLAELRTFKSFSHGKSNTVWLDPSPTDGVVDLQTTFWRHFSDYDDTRAFPAGFTPHLSVGQVRGDGARESLLRSLQEAWEPLTFTADRVSLIWRNAPPDDVFRVWRHVELGSGRIIHHQDTKATKKPHSG